MSAGRASQRQEQIISLTRLSSLRVFLQNSPLEKLKCFANRELHHRGHALPTCQELLGFVVLHVLCASYEESPSVLCDSKDGEFFFDMGLSAERYREVWSSLTGCKEKRSSVGYSATGCCRSANRTTSLITDIESEVAAVNRELLYVPNATILSLDDDHLRMASRAVTYLSFLNSTITQRKVLGQL